MFYEFPTINHISDVLPHIEDRKEFRVVEKDWYTVINYAVAFDTTFEWDFNDPVGSAIRRECRGITFDKEGKLICRKYHKFFNVGERDETQLNKINLYDPHIVLEKLDGSLISIQPSHFGFRLVSKMGVTDVAMNAEVFIADKPQYAQFINYCIAENYCTPIFEWVSRKNRIVVDYPEDNLILTAIRYTTSGKYISYDEMCKYGRIWNIPVVKSIAGDETDITKVVDHIRKWDDGEGVVVRFNSGHMVKIKSSDYVLRHKSKDAINQEKNVIQTILNDSVDDLIPLLTPEDAERIRNFEKAFWKSLEDVATDIHDAYMQIDKGQDQKEFATVAVPSVLSYYQPFMFKLRKGIPVRDLLIEQIGKSLSSQSKIDSVRWMFGEIRWNYQDK